MSLCSLEQEINFEYFENKKKDSYHPLLQP